MTLLHRVIHRASTPLAAHWPSAARRHLHRSAVARLAAGEDHGLPSAASARDRLRVCVVGAGPAGFYAAKYLLKEHEDVYVDMLEALPTPYGLVRSGVAPDHPEVKSVMNDFEKVAAEPRFDFLGNVRVGEDVHLEELKAHYHAILLAYGASADRTLGVPGEHLQGVHSARAFVNWYNGHPAFRDLNPNLAVDTAVIFGQGNVAIDCARILTKSVDELKTTDIAEHALEALRQSKIKRVYVVGRRGSAQAAFTMKEIREITKLDGVSCVVDPSDLEKSMNDASAQEIKEQRAKKRMHELLSKVAADVDKARAVERQIHVKFLASPVELVADAANPEHVGSLVADAANPEHVGSVRLEKTRLEGSANRQVAVGTGEHEELACGLVLRSIGYKSEPIDDVPFHPTRHVVANEQGRVVSPRSGEVIPGLYCAGWLKRGPSGIIGSNIVDSRETVACIMEDASANKLLSPSDDSQGLASTVACIMEDASANKLLSPSDDSQGLASVRHLVRSRQPEKPLVSWQDVERLHGEEETRGATRGKPREKFTSVEEMLSLLTKSDH
ncbi:hypothetical protein P43SY_004929 [Pythium insidiosum]|uniref:NADPH:adrenodoxin oxidoreductase, mitochondrial n=1 Tax=Pythium insidiosum TaxID=114742 RepID=A0AAD5Q6I0_PYTIN|nr:hypothetical protein P43SY_004929 [Pythium insidiosum]